MTTLSDQAEYDLYGSAVIADPYPAYHAMRAAAPLVRAGGVWYVTTYASDWKLPQCRHGGRGMLPVWRVKTCPCLSMNKAVLNCLIASNAPKGNCEASSE